MLIFITLSQKYIIWLCKALENIVNLILKFLCRDRRQPSSNEQIESDKMCDLTANLVSYDEHQDPPNSPTSVFELCNLFHSNVDIPIVSVLSLDEMVFDKIDSLPMRTNRRKKAVVKQVERKEYCTPEKPLGSFRALQNNSITENKRNKILKACTCYEC